MPLKLSGGAMSNTTSAQPGWYPAEPGIERYWDGTQWTSAVRSAALVPHAPAAPVAVQGNPLGITGFVLAIVGAIFACVPPLFLFGWILLPASFVIGVVAAALAGRRKWAGITAIVVSIVGTIAGITAFVIFAVSNSAGASSSIGSSSSSSSSEDRRVPTGFEDTGSGLAIHFVDNPSCSLSIGTCAVVEVYALRDCPSMVYVEANVLDSSGTVIGMTNDSVGRLGAGARARLELPILESEGVRVKLTETSCL